MNDPSPTGMWHYGNPRGCGVAIRMPSVKRYFSMCTVHSSRLPYVSIKVLLYVWEILYRPNSFNYKQNIILIGL